MLQEAASADRWTSKVLSYPCFGFREAIASTRLVNLQFVLAVDVTSEEQFAAKVFEWTSASAPSAHEQLQQRTQMLEQFWLFARAAQSVFTESLGCTRWASLGARKFQDEGWRAPLQSSSRAGSSQGEGAPSSGGQFLGDFYAAAGSGAGRKAKVGKETPRHSRSGRRPRNGEPHPEVREIRDVGRSQLRASLPNY